MAPIKTFLLEKIPKCVIELRRYESGPRNCKGQYGYHNASISIGEIDSPVEARGEFDIQRLPNEDPRWPQKCDYCEFVFYATDVWQVNHVRLWKRSDTGALLKISDAPVGSVYRADWYENDDGTPNNWTGLDGKAYYCVVPENADGTGRHPWHIDGQATNCTLKEDSIHKCWCRHGVAPDFHVDKNGNTCAAGAGSILIPSGFHGFLHHGTIISC